MFSFGEKDAPAKTAATRKKSRRVSLADRSRSRNDENAMPPSTPRGHKGLAGKGASLQTQQAFIQAATKAPALGACPVSTTPSRQGGAGGASGGGGGAAEMFNQNIELKRRQKELETVVQGCEATTKQLQDENCELRRQSSKAQADAERASARADSASAEAEGLRRDLETAREDAKTARAEVAGLRREARTASTETASVRRDAATARDEATLARAEAEAATARAESAELAAARANEELGRVTKEVAAKAEEAARKAAKAVKAEAAKAAKATASAAAAQKAAASAKAAAAAEVAAANSRAEAAQAAVGALQAEKEEKLQQQQQHQQQQQPPHVHSLAESLEAFAARISSRAEASCHPKSGKKRGRGVATTALAGERVGGSHKTASMSNGGGQAELPDLTKGFCGLLAAYTAQGLPLTALSQLLEAAPSLGEQLAAAEGNGGGGETRGVPPAPLAPAEGSKLKSRAVVVRQDRSASAVPTTPAAPAAAGDASVTPPSAAAAAAAAAASFSAASAVAVVVTPPESTVPTARPTTSRREMLNARRAQQEKDAREKQRLKEEQEREKAERQRVARQKRKKEAAARQKATEAAARPHEARNAAREAAAAASSCALPPLQQQGREQEQGQERAQPQGQQNQHEHSQEAEVQKKLSRAQSTKSRRPKQSLHHHQQQQQQHAQTPAQPAGEGIAPNASTRASPDPMAEPPLDVGLSFSTSSAGPQPIKEVPASDTPAVPPAAAPADKDDVGAFVEEVPMPTGDIDNGFFCADVGVGGVGGAEVGLIVGGGVSDGDGYGMVDAWSHQQDEPTAVVGSSGTPDTAAGGKRKKGKGRPRKIDTVAESSSSESGDGQEGKKKRRRSMRMAKAPIKFGSEEPLAEVVGGVPSAESRRDHSKNPGPRLATFTVDPPAGVSRGSGGSAQHMDRVAPALPSHAPSSTSENGTAGAVSARAEPVGTAVDGAIDAPVSDICSAAAASTIAHSSTAQCQALPVKRKPAGSKKNIRTIRYRGSGLPGAPGAARSLPQGGADVAAASPPSRAVSAKAAVNNRSATSPKENMSATAVVAKRAVDNLFDTAALKLSVAPPSNAAAAAAVAAAAAKSAGKSKEKPPTVVGKGVARASKTEAPPPAMAERLLPFRVEVTDGITTRDIVETASSRSWVGGGGSAEEGPRGALTGVLATAHVLMEKHFRVRGHGLSAPLSAVPPEALRHFRSLLAAIVATEGCAMMHELRAGTEAAEAVPLSAWGRVAGDGAPAAAAAAAAAVKAKATAKAASKKRVRFFAFDLSTVDMPTDAIEDSDAAAKEVAQCLAHVVASAKLLQKALPKRAAGRAGSGGGGSGDGDGGLSAVLEAFMRGLKTVAVVGVPGSSPLVASVRGACQEFGSEVSAEVVKRAASFLLQSLESLTGGPEVAARCPLRRRLAGMLSALIRFNLRVLLNPPPHKSVSSLHIAESADRPRKVHEVIQLVSEEAKLVSKKDVFDPTRDGATSAVVSRALRRLYGFSDEGAVEVMSTAEAFVAGAKSRSDISDEEKALQARRHSQDTVDIVAAIRARSFVLELLEFPGVELAVSQTRGWGELERLSTELRQVEDAPDADASLTLLGEVRGLKAWLRGGSPWRHGERAKAVLTRLDEVLVGCDKKEAKRFSQEARRRMWFPRVTSPEPLREVGSELH